MIKCRKLVRRSHEMMVKEQHVIEKKVEIIEFIEVGCWCALHERDRFGASELPHSKT